MRDLCDGIKITELESAHPDATIAVTSRGDPVGDLDFDRDPQA